MLSVYLQVPKRLHSINITLEFLPAKNRGIPLTLFEFFWTVGTIGEAGLAWYYQMIESISYIRVVLPSLGWRWLLGISTIPVSILLFFYPFLPESPRYLLVSGKYDKAVEQLEKLAKFNG